MRLVDMPDGLHPNIPEAQYHEKVLGLASKGALVELDRSPAHYRTWLAAPETEDVSGPFKFGRWFHCAVLEPGRFESTFVAEPSFGDMRTKIAKEKREAWCEENAGRSPIPADDFAAIVGMRSALRAHSLAGRALQDGVAELTALWTDKTTGVRCRSRTDLFSQKRGMLLDVKSTRDASSEGFKKDVANYLYHWQAALYRDGFAAVGAEVRHFVFVAVEKTPPYAVCVYTLNADAIARGYHAVRTNIDLMAECLRDDAWPGYPEHIHEIELPPWAA